MKLGYPNKRDKKNKCTDKTRGEKNMLQCKYSLNKVFLFPMNKP